MPPTHILSPLKGSVVARIWSALAFSALGDQLYVVALGFVAVDAFGPAAGYLSAVRSAVILAACLSGGFADRWPSRASMVVADVVRAVVLLVLVAAWIGSGAPSAGLLALVIIALATGEAVFEPALQALVPTLVPEPRLLVATNGLFDATDRLARLLGPGLIALLGGLVPVVHLFSFDAASFLVSAIAVASLRNTNAPRRSPHAPSLGLRASLAGGLAAIRREPLLAYALDIKSVSNGVWYAVFFLVVPLVILNERIAAPGGPALAAYGLVIACYGVSNLGANLIVGSLPLPRRPAQRVLAGVLTTGSGILLMAAVCAAPLPQNLRLPALAAASAISGFGGPLQDITLSTLRQTLIPPDAIAAATRVMLIATCIGTLIAMLVAPALIETLGPVAVMAFGGSAYIVCAALCRLRPTAWRSEPCGTT